MILYNMRTGPPYRGRACREGKQNMSGPAAGLGDVVIGYDLACIGVVGCTHK